jgi:hypothetical protein
MMISCSIEDTTTGSEAVLLESDRDYWIDLDISHPMRLEPMLSQQVKMVPREDKPNFDGPWQPTFASSCG